jgi:hypothetical protein
MKFADPQGKFPKFKDYIVYGIGPLSSNDVIVNGLKKWGKMSSEQARSYLLPGSGPKIKILDDKDYYLSKAVFEFPESFNLNFTLVNNYEIKDTLSIASAKGPTSAVYKTGSGKKIFRVGLVILHHLIEGHLRVFSNDDDDRDRAKVTIRQLAFEDEVYGGVDYAS